MSHSPMTELMKDNVIQDLYETRQTIYVGIVGFTILVWDHIVTSADEIELIWRRPKKTLVYLFLLNRYLTPLVFIVNLVAYTLPSWDDTSCRHFVRYEGATTAVGIEIVGLMMLLRVIAMYKNQWAAIAPAVFLLLAWIVVTAWLLSHGEPVLHSDHVQSCTMVFDSGSIASATAWLPLLYDTYVFGLTLNRTLPSIRNKEVGHVFRTLFADGLLYYSVICTVNLVLTIMIVRAHEGIKNIAAQLELLLTVTMMSRITLNIRKQSFHGHHSQAESFIMSTRNDTICTPSGGVVLSRLRSHSVSSAARVESSSRARSGSVSSIVSPVRTITLPENPLIFAARPRLSTIFSATNTPTTLSPSGSPVSEYVDWPSASNSDQRNTTNIV
ncbi:hypothetical protein DFJ58DRAFT_766723 [Suillus subalutaceus]|uniref:uncharacterized protein n=1 Tax=Suillus subalutaceus TaxID=48586 RepID=UPI001B867A69|nr:uncharacterized protein DFJ58DRAFT_766723 [Suillus subalutaceus]KAG1869028.1 hypothetical protein DFJ58DRAFT_766723 [Suillus subalutaceus]